MDKLKIPFRTVLHRYFSYKHWPKHPIREWKEQFPKRGIWPIGSETLKKYYTENLSMYGKKFLNEPTLMKLSSKAYKKANWNKQFFTKTETRQILADINYKSFNKLVQEGYLTPHKLGSKKAIYYSSEQIQRELLIRELLISMCDNIRVRDARLRQMCKKRDSVIHKRMARKKKRERMLLKEKEKEQNAGE